MITPAPARTSRADRASQRELLFWLPKTTSTNGVGEGDSKGDGVRDRVIVGILVRVFVGVMVIVCGGVIEGV